MLVLDEIGVLKRRISALNGYAISRQFKDGRLDGVLVAVDYRDWQNGVWT